MARKNVINYLLNPENWWLPLLIIFTISIAGVTMIGIHTYTEGPLYLIMSRKKEKLFFQKKTYYERQAMFQKYALMEYGTMFGDGALRGPDYTAEALLHISQYMNDYFVSKFKNDTDTALLKKGVGEQVKSVKPAVLINMITAYHSPMPSYLAPES